MSGEEELKTEIERLKKEIELLKLQSGSQSQGIVKKKVIVAGDRTKNGIFKKEMKKIDFSSGFDKEEVTVTSHFSVKGHRLEQEKVCRCSFCNLILTELEKIEIVNRIYCENCYRKEEHDLDKDDYKVLLCTSNGYTSTSSVLEYLGYVVTVQTMAGLPKYEVIKKLEKLLGSGHLFLYGLILKRIKISSKGEEAMSGYNQIYRDEDCELVKKRIDYCGGR